MPGSKIFIEYVPCCLGDLVGAMTFLTQLLFAVNLPNRSLQ